jgi:hypothetical protein
MRGQKITHRYDLGSFEQLKRQEVVLVTRQKEIRTAGGGNPKKIVVVGIGGDRDEW